MYVSSKCLCSSFFVCRMGWYLFHPQPQNNQPSTPVRWDRLWALSPAGRRNLHWVLRRPPTRGDPHPVAPCTQTPRVLLFLYTPLSLYDLPSTFTASLQHQTPPPGGTTTALRCELPSRTLDPGKEKRGYTPGEEKGSRAPDRHTRRRGTVAMVCGPLTREQLGVGLSNGGWGQDPFCPSTFSASPSLIYPV